MPVFPDFEARVGQGRFSDSKNSTIQAYSAILVVFMSSFLSRKRDFTPAQLERASNIFDNAGQGFFVVFLLTQVVEGFDKLNPMVVVLGILSVVFCWTVSIILAKRKEMEK